MPFPSLRASALPATVRDMLEERAAATPQAIACVTAEGEWTYAELDHLADCMAGALHHRGLGPGERVLAVMPNCFDMVCVYFAAAKLGAVISFVNPDYERELFNALLRSIAPTVVVLEGASLAKLDSDAKVPVVIGWPDASADRVESLSFRALLAESRRPWPRPELRAGDPSQLIFTSGTTGLPKACILSHRARIALVAHINDCLQATAGDRFHASLPNSHGNVFLGLLGAVLAGATCILAERFSASSFWAEVRQQRATLLVLHGVPLNILLANPKADGERRHAVRAVLTIGGRYPEFLSRFDVAHAVIGYGSTEAGGLVALARVGQEEARSLDAGFAGWVREDIEVRIADHDDEELPAGERGEILVRPRCASVISDGFSGLAEATLSSRRNLWLHTGDLGCLASDGILHFAGRARDAVRVGGEFIPVEYLEDLVRRHDCIEDCAIVGVAAAIGEEEMTLFVQLKTAQVLSVQALLDYLRPLVPKFMLPRRVAFVDSFPRASTTLKIQKAKLIEGMT